MTATAYDICALGNAIVDIVADVPEIFLLQQHLTKGKASLVDRAQVANLRKLILKPRSIRAGGAASNTVAALASFGGKPAYMGKVAYDEAGRLFSEDITKLGIRYPTEPVTDESIATGMCFAFVTPDAHRTMRTYLGASANFGPGDIDMNVLRQSKIVYLEGYMLDKPNTKDALHAAASNAKAAGCKVALSLCDVSCVERNRQAFLDLIAENADLIFANEKELMALYKTFHLDTAVQHVKEHVKTAIITRSENGAIILDDKRLLNVNADAVHMVDKTGAGDAFAAGYLYGLSKDLDAGICAKLGVIAAGEIISHFGSRPEHSLAALAKQKGVAI